MLLSLTAAHCILAIQPTKMQIRRVAAQALQRTDLPEELAQTGKLSVMGFRDGGFAVVVAADSVPLVVGVSPTVFNTHNANLMWWLQAMSQATADPSMAITRRRQNRISPKLPSHVEPLLQTRWGQGEPYNRLCPTTADGERCATGCVATSMAQVLCYHQSPEHCTGGRQTIYYPKGDTDGTPVSVDFDTVVPDWANMRPDYTNGYSETEALAVARLMLACGVAADMGYDVPSRGGSGALHVLAQAGLNRHFGYSSRYTARGEGISDERWMNIIYSELAERRPVIYGGQGVQGGHSFVLHGYREDGLVYINWGWEGDADGYYDLELLNPKTYSFADSQEMIYNIKSTDYMPLLLPINTAEAGTLAERLTATGAFNFTDGRPQLQSPYEGISIAGPLNSTDLKTLRQLLGCDDHGLYTDGQPTIDVDLSAARIVAGGEPYLIEQGRTYTTDQPDIVPYRAFADCQSLHRMVLPAATVAIGDGVWANCVALQSVVDPQPEAHSFVIDDGYIYNKEKTTLIAALPIARMKTDTLRLPDGLRAIRPLAFAGYQELHYVELPATLDTIGSGAFQNSTAIRTIKLLGRQLPTLGSNVFAGITATCTLRLWAGLRKTALRSSQWRDFSRIDDYGTVIAAISTTRPAGSPNPAFGFTTLGEPFDGEPLLWCDADEQSLPGTYIIHCERGTVTSPDVEFIDGRLLVTEAAGMRDNLKTRELNDDERYDLGGRQARRGVVIQQRTKRKWIENK